MRLVGKRTLTLRTEPLELPGVVQLIKWQTRNSETIAFFVITKCSPGGHETVSQVSYCRNLIVERPQMPCSTIHHFLSSKATPSPGGSPLIMVECTISRSHRIVSLVHWVQCFPDGFAKPSVDFRAVQDIPSLFPSVRIRFALGSEGFPGLLQVRPHFLSQRHFSL